MKFVGRGGMGEVYEALDLELHERVALKTILADITDDPGVLMRFRREIQLARRVTHPNVCRVFDLWRHVTESGERLSFVAMEFLDGETLDERLVRDGRMRTGEALPIVRQIAGGLAAAHHAGVVHRDLKAGNVMLVPSMTADSEVRAVITDFGLAFAPTAEGRGEESARSSDTGGASSRIVLQGAPAAVSRLFGTPDSMAPEQVTGGEISRATDIYALGVLLFELATGATPFGDGSPEEVALRRLTEAPCSPRTYVPDLDPRWEAAVQRCLERDPKDRFAGVDEVVRALTGEDPVAVPRSLAVLEPIIDSDQPASAAWLATALVETLTRKLETDESLQVVDRATVDRAMRDLDLRPAATRARRDTERIRSLLLVEAAISGIVTHRNDTLTLELRVQDLRTAQVLTTVTCSGHVDALAELAERAGTELRAALGLGGTTAESLRVRTSLPISTEASRVYTIGLDQLRRLDADLARRSLEEAIDLEPSFPLAHLALAESWHALGQEAHAVDAARRAFALSDGLSRLDRIAVEARYRSLAREWDRALDLYNSLWIFQPDSVEDGLRLVAVQIEAGRTADALRTIESLRALPDPHCDDPRIDLEEATAALAGGDSDRGLASSVRALERGRQTGSRSMHARALDLRGRALAARDQLDMAEESLREAQREYRELADRGGEIEVLFQLGQMNQQRGQLDASRKVLEEAGALSQETGKRNCQGRALERLSGLDSLCGNLPAARELAERAAAIFQEIGDGAGWARTVHMMAINRFREGAIRDAVLLFQQATEAMREIGVPATMVRYLSNLGMARTEAGDLAGARAAFEEALALRPKLTSPAQVADLLYQLAMLECRTERLPEATRALEESLSLHRSSGARIRLPDDLVTLGYLRWMQGDLHTARPHVEEALDLAKENGWRRQEALARSYLSTMMLDVDELAPAEQHVEEAIRICRELSAGDLLLEALLQSGSLHIARGAFPAAEALVDEALILIRSQGRTDREALALCVRAQCLMETGRMDEAEVVIATARALLAKTGTASRLHHLEVALISGAVQTAMGRPGESMRVLNEAVAEAAERGFGKLVLEGRLNLGQAEIAAGSRESGRERLLTLATEARAAGFLRIAGRALDSAEG